MESKEIVRLRNLKKTLAQFKQERKELEISIPYIESQIAELRCQLEKLQKNTVILPISQSKRKPTVGFDIGTGDIVCLATGKVIPPPPPRGQKESEMKTPALSAAYRAARAADTAHIIAAAADTAYTAAEFAAARANARAITARADLAAARADLAAARTALAAARADLAAKGGAS